MTNGQSMGTKSIRDGEVWTVLAEVQGEGVGLPRGTRIRVVGNDDELTLIPLGLHDWSDDPALKRIKPQCDVDAPGQWDPEWCWEGTVNRNGAPHAIKLGWVRGDPGVLTLFVNQKGIAVILR